MSEANKPATGSVYRYGVRWTDAEELDRVERALERYNAEQHLALNGSDFLRSAASRWATEILGDATADAAPERQRAS